MIRWISRSLVLFAVLVFLGFLFLITPAGLNVSYALIQKHLPGKLSFKKLNGTIFGPINVIGLHYQNDQWDIQADDVHLEWRLPMLLFKKLDIADLRAHHLVVINKSRITAPHLPTTGPNTQKLSLAFGLTIEQAHISRIEYRALAQHHDIKVKRLDARNFKLSRRKIRGDIVLVLQKPYAVTNFITLNGELSQYRFNWILVKNHERLYITGHGTRGSAYVFLNRNKLFGGALHGKVQFSWYPYFTWNTHLKLQNIDLKRFDTRLPKIQEANIHSTGIWQEALPRFNCDILLINPGNRLSVIGVYSNAWNINWRANLTDLSQLLPKATGKIISEGSIFGEKTSPKISAELLIERLNVGDYHAKYFNGKLLLDLTQQVPSSIDIEAKRLYIPNFDAKKLKLTGQTTKDFGRLGLKVELNNSNTKHLVMATELAGKFDRTFWHGQITSLALQSDEIGVWKTLRPSALTLALPDFSLKETSLSSTLGTITFSLANQQQQWQVAAHGQLQNLNSISRVFSKYLTITSAATFKLNAHGQADQVKAIDADFDTEAGRIEYERNFERFSIPFKQMAIHAKTTGHDLHATLFANTTQEDHLNITLKFSNLLEKILEAHEHPLSGEMNLHFSKLKLLQFFIPEISEPTGIVSGKFSLAGTVENPNVRGKLSLLDGQVDIPSLKVQLDNLKLNLSAEKQTVKYHATAESQGQTIHAEGTTDFSGEDISSAIRITGKNILIVNTPEYTIYADANLMLKMNGQASTLSGSIFIPRALIKPADFSTTVTLSDDIEIIHANKSVQKSPWLWYYDLNITLGDDITIDSYGLKSKLAGNAQLTSNPQQPTVVATGQLRLVDATYNTQGKQLSIESNSYINYSHDPLRNPHLNIRMSRTVTVLLSSEMSPIGPTEALVGIDIKGTVKHPRVSMFSSPMTLSQADIISYLLFNQSASGNTSSLANAGIIIQAVQSLKLGGKSDVSSIGQIQQSLGIAELGVQQQTYIDAFGTPLGVNQSSFVLGKYITPKIYVRYSHALGSATTIDIYQLRYIINKNWAIQAETGSVQIGNGMDLLYTVSRKKFPW